MIAKWLRILAGLLITLLLAAHSAQLTDWRYLRELDARLYDIRLRMSMPGGIDPRVVIVNIDEKSLVREGQWPWPREKLAKLVHILFDTYRVDTLGFDMVFAERDENRDLQRLRSLALSLDKASFVQELKTLEPALDQDRQFAQALSRTNTVLGYYFGNDDSGADNSGLLPAPVFGAESGLYRKTRALRASRYTANLPILQKSAKTGGFFSSFLVDTDGIFRRVPMLLEYEKKLYGSLSLMLVSRYLDAPIEAQVMPETGLEKLVIGPNAVELDPNAAVLIPYRGKQGSFRYLSATDILHQQIPDPGRLENTMVIVGSTAAGLLDHRATPVQSVYPGVEIHANVVAGLLDNRFMQQPVWMQYAESLLILLVGIVLSLTLPFLPVMAATLLGAGTWLAVVGLNFYLWQSAHLVMPLAASLLLMAAIYALNIVLGFFTESRNRRMLQNMFGQYVPPEIVNEMSSNPETYTLNSEKREMTVMFTDIRDFTSISETLDPQELSELMNQFLTAMTGIIHRHHGTIDKYMGDAIMAFWGAPLRDEEHAQHALEAALEKHAALTGLNRLFAKKGWPALEIGTGVNTGPMSVGNMGSEFRLAYTVLGDSVNLGARLEGLAKVYGAPIVVNETTVAAVSGFVFRELDRVRVKGKTEPVTIYQLLGNESDFSADSLSKLDQYHAALDLYRQGRWQQAATAFNELSHHNPDVALYTLYRERSAFFAGQPPDADWDGIFDYPQK